MNVKKIIRKLKKLYPGKNIILNDPKNPTEIICEIQTAFENPNEGIAVAIIDESKSHVHYKTKETYKILEGELVFFRNGKEELYKKGDRFDIYPGEIHSVKGEEVWVKCVSRPAWAPKDHIRV